MESKPNVLFKNQTSEEKPCFQGTAQLLHAFQYLERGHEIHILQFLALKIKNIRRGAFNNNLIQYSIKG
jgi:hypothetical protein